MTLSRLRKAAAKRTRDRQISEVDVAYSQDKSHAFRGTLLLSGDAVIKGVFGDNYIHGFLFSNRKQSAGQVLHLTGLLRRESIATWTPCWIQVCDGNVLTLGGCADNVTLYEAAPLHKTKKPTARQPRGQIDIDHPRCPR